MSRDIADFSLLCCLKLLFGDSSMQEDALCRRCWGAFIMTVMSNVDSIFGGVGGLGDRAAIPIGVANWSRISGRVSSSLSPSESTSIQLCSCPRSTGERLFGDGGLPLPEVSDVAAVAMECPRALTERVGMPAEDSVDETDSSSDSSSTCRPWCSRNDTIDCRSFIDPKFCTPTDPDW